MTPMPGEKRVAWALATLAGLRVLVFSLAFPFFSNVDEYRHFDVVLKYARGALPAPGPERYEPETAVWVGSFGSPEYHRDPQAGGEVPLPAWRQPDAVREMRVARMQRYLEPLHSLEASQPPVYYATAGAWFALGRSLGLEGLALLYWLRLLGAAAAFALVLGAWWGLRDLYPDSRLVRLGTPLLLAFVPQDSMYYVTGDVFSPLLGGLSFVLLLRLVRRPAASAGEFALAGLLLAATFLTKYPGAALIAACATVGVAVAARPEAERVPWRRAALFFTALLAPILLWLGRNWLLGGDLTATAFKVEKLGWEPKPPAEWLDHPLFSVGGAWTFLRDAVPRFWRGELVWHTEELAWPGADRLYLVSSVAFVAFAALGLRHRERAASARLAEAAALAATLCGLAILAMLSLVFVFGENTSPSAGYPYFVNGRLVSAVLLPFALLYVRGIEEAASWLPAPGRRAVAWALLASVLGVAFVSELALTRPVFLSAYNGFHLP